MSDRSLRIEEFCQKEPILLTHLEAVLKQNLKMNLTSIRELNVAKVLHIEDSLAVLPEVEAAPRGSLADLGSGAGYPGIPLALLSKRNTTLIEANNKKAEFLIQFIKENKLKDYVSVAMQRSEELASVSPESFMLVTARAVAELPVLLELAAPLLEYGGQLLALKGRPQERELERGEKVGAILGMAAVYRRSYRLSSGEQRCVLVYEKRGASIVKVPRRPGVASKKPLA